MLPAKEFKNGGVRMIGRNDRVVTWLDANTVDIMPTDLPRLSYVEFLLRDGIIQYQFRIR